MLGFGGGLFHEVSCVEALVPSAAMFRGGALGSDWVTRARMSSMDQSTDGLII